MSHDEIAGPVAPASASRANQSPQEHQNSTDCSASEAVSPRLSHLTRPPRRTRYIDFAEVNGAALCAFPVVLRRLLPGGKRMGKEYVALNPRRPDRRLGSFKINLYNGKWSDFATGDKGGDLISLVAYLADVSQGEAARLLARMLEIEAGGPRHG
jgi:hypothetical protein